MQHRASLALILSFCTFLPVAGQSPTKPADEKDDVVRITTNLVQVDAVVTKDGKPVTDLKAEDFEIYEDGKKQTITTFAYVSNFPNAPNAAAPPAPSKGRAVIPPVGPIQRDVARRTVAIVVDDLGVSAESMHHVRRQLRKFIAEEVQPDDLVAIIRTGGEMGALQQFTNDKRMLNRAVDLLRWNACSRLGFAPLEHVGDPGGGGCYYSSTEQSLRALRFVLDAMGRLPGRKSVVLMSDDMPVRREQNGTVGAEQVLVGGDVRNYGDWLQRITETAIRSSVVIYSVDTQGLQVTGITAADSVTGSIPRGVGAGAGDGVPERSARLGSLVNSRSRILVERQEGGLLVAERTGGFQVRNSNGFQLDRIIYDQSGYYLLGYRPSEVTFNRQFHHLKAKVKRSGMKLRTRYGFYGVSEEEADRGRPTIQDQMTLALLSPFGAQDLEVYQNSFFANPKTDGSVIRSFVYLNPANLNFVAANGRHETPIEIHGAIFGDNGAVIEKVKHDIVLSMGDKEYEHAMRDGLPDAVRLRFDLTVKKPGSYQVRIAVRDRTSSKIGSAGQFVVVPDLKKKRVALSGVVLRGATEGPMQLSTMSSPPARRFSANAELNYGFVVYNAPIDPATQLPNLTMQVKLYRDGRSLGPAVEAPIDVGNQADLSRLFITGSVRLSSNLEPGNYYLQVVIVNKAVKDKQPSVTQWVDFEIVK
jgi:VWFA-related protein